MQMYNKPKQAVQEEVRLIASPFAKLLTFKKYQGSVGTVRSHCGRAAERSKHVHNRHKIFSYMCPLR